MVINFIIKITESSPEKFIKLIGNILSGLVMLVLYNLGIVFPYSGLNKVPPVSSFFRLELVEFYILSLRRFFVSLSFLTDSSVTLASISLAHSPESLVLLIHFVSEFVSHS